MMVAGSGVADKRDAEHGGAGFAAGGGEAAGGPVPAGHSGRVQQRQELRHQRAPRHKVGHFLAFEGNSMLLQLSCLKYADDCQSSWKWLGWYAVPIARVQHQQELRHSRTVWDKVKCCLLALPHTHSLAYFLVLTRQ